MRRHFSEKVIRTGLSNLQIILDLLSLYCPVNLNLILISYGEFLAITGASKKQYARWRAQGQIRREYRFGRKIFLSLAEVRRILLRWEAERKKTARRAALGSSRFLGPQNDTARPALIPSPKDVAPHHRAQPLPPLPPQKESTRGAPPLPE